MNTYNSIVPSEITNQELRAICADIQTAKNWGLNHATVILSQSDTPYQVPVSRHADYQEAYRTETN